MTKEKSEDSIDMFYGFWKYLGVMGSFIIGVILFWWGSSILINDFFVLRETFGAMAFLTLAPLVCGGAMAWMSFAEFLRIIRIKE